MKIQIADGLPFVTLTVVHQKRLLTLSRVLLDTGSTGTLLALKYTASLDLLPKPDDELYNIEGVGGTEFVYEKRVDKIQAGDLEVRSFKVQISDLNYSVEMDGILGFDFLRQTKAMIDLANLELKAGS